MRFSKKNVIYLVIVLFLLTFVVDGLFVFSNKAEGKKSNQQEGEFIINGEEKVQVGKPLSPSSPFADASARIDSRAATCQVGAAASCQTLPAQVWIFVLVSFLALLIFNLAYGFEKTERVQWGWESGLLLLTLLAWWRFDQCRSSIWFPLYTVKFGLIIYLVYLYFFNKKEEKIQKSLF